GGVQCAACPCAHRAVVGERGGAEGQGAVAGVGRQGAVVDESAAVQRTDLAVYGEPGSNGEGLAGRDGDAVGGVRIPKDNRAGAATADRLVGGGDAEYAGAGEGEGSIGVQRDAAGRHRTPAGGCERGALQVDGERAGQAVDVGGSAGEGDG